MKIALLVICGLLILGAAVYLIGALLPKSHSASRSALYSVPPERLFSLIEGAQDWRPDVAKFESVLDPAGRHLVRETNREGETISYELLQITPPTSLKRRIVSENLPYTGTWTILLQREGEATRVQITEDGEVYNPIFRFISHFLIGHHGTIDDYLRALGQATNQEIQIQD
jgi:Polyketide cyclase / dehydrase and lipid transport